MRSAFPPRGAKVDPSTFPRPVRRSGVGPTTQGCKGSGFDERATAWRNGWTARGRTASRALPDGVPWRARSASLAGTSAPCAATGTHHGIGSAANSHSEATAS